MATSSLIQRLINEPKSFQSFVDENMKISTYIAEWQLEGLNLDFCAQKVYSEVIAEYAAATVGSVVAANASKPTHELPAAGQLTGAITRMADEWQLSNEKLEQFRYLEGRFADRSSSYTESTRDAEYQRLVKFLFDPFEKAVIAPHKRVDMLYFEGLFNGTQTVSAKNNTKSAVSFTYDLGVHKEKVATSWSKETADPVGDIEKEIKRLAGKGKSVRAIRMSRSTFRAMCNTKKFQDGFTMVGNKSRATGLSILSLDAVNEYFLSAQLPAIQVEKDRFVTLADGSIVNMTVDNRVVFQCAEKVAVIKASDVVEKVDPLPDKVYAEYNGNLVGYWRDVKGRFVDYEMYAIPVFTGQNNYSILDVE